MADPEDVRLWGRTRERAVLDGLLGAIRNDEGRTLVLRG